MFKSINTRWSLIAFILLLSAWKVYPTFQHYSLSVSERAELEEQKNEVYLDNKGNAIKLGLDLQGGMYVVLEADMPLLVKNLTPKDKFDEHLNRVIENAKTNSINNESFFFDEFEKLLTEIELKKYFRRLPGIQSSSNSDILTELKAQGDKAIASALEVLRNRIDEFGVSEPNIQRSGKSRIIVELAGVKDIQRAADLIQKTALLEFILVKQDSEFAEVITRLDNALKVDTEIKTDEVIESNEKFDLMKEGEEAPVSLDIDQPGKPFSKYIELFPGGQGVLENNYTSFETLIQSDDVRRNTPKDSKFLFGKELKDQSGRKYKNIYFVKATAELEGDVIDAARARLGDVGSDQSGRPIVNLTMNKKGANTWRQFTGENINRRVALVMDNTVYMAPSIKDKISGGRTQISGLDSIEEAKDIANVLQAGQLPTRLNFAESRMVDPSLGKDSINAGSMAMIYGLLIVMGFMVFYYKGAGLLADIALILNLFIVIAVLASIGATLTLPGIAGLILTIGMAVDANVIVFERIREELSKGKTVKASIESGYDRAFTTILDANITTLIAAFALMWIGSGPIKGFAVTLSIGILASMFTAVFVTRTIFMMFGNKKPLTKLSI